MSDSDARLALAHYRLKFPTLESLGENAAAWQAEYDRVAASGLTATLITSNSFEGGSASAIKNFPQEVLLLALHTRRAELDPDYDELVFAAANVKPRLQLGIPVRIC